MLQDGFGAVWIGGRCAAISGVRAGGLCDRAPTLRLSGDALKLLGAGAVVLAVIYFFEFRAAAAWAETLFERLPAPI